MRELSGRIPDSQACDPGFESPFTTVSKIGHFRSKSMSHFILNPSKGFNDSLGTNKNTIDTLNEHTSTTDTKCKDFDLKTFDRNKVE